MQQTEPCFDRPMLLSRRTLLRQTAALGLTAPTLAALVSSSVRLARASDSVSGLLDAALAAAVDAGLPGVSLLVERAGTLVYAGAVGVASIELERPLTTTDRHRIYSIAKMFTAVVTLQLVDEGVLALDDAVTKWLDEPVVRQIPDVDRVTLRQLLNHTSGIYDFADDDSPFWEDAFLGKEADWTKVWRPVEILRYADGASHAPYFAPGDGYHYSNTNYILVGLIVEQATGRTFADEFRSRILEPLALDDTFLVEGATMPDGTVDAYQLLDGQLVNVSATNLSWDWAAGGMVSTAVDLARFARAVFSGELLSPASFAEMFTFVPMGMGIYPVQTPNGEVVGMDGQGPGASSLMMRLEEADLTVVVLANMAPDEGATEIVRDEVIGAVLASA